MSIWAIWKNMRIPRWPIWMAIWSNLEVDLDVDLESSGVIWMVLLIVTGLDGDPD